MIILLFSLKSRNELKSIPNEEVDFACIITVYNNLAISLPLVNSVLSQRYEKFHVYLVADKVTENQYYIENEKFTFIKPQLDLNSKVLSIDTALRAAVRHHDYVLILDPDNLLHPDFLKEVNHFHAQGFAAVQGKRTAKNLDTDFAALDAMGEYYYDYIVRNAPFEAGSSSTIAGSGMSVERKLYNEVIQMGLEELKDKGIVVSEDKTLQIKIVERGERIAYAGRAIIFDEKVSNAVQIERQRTRWLNSYFRHLQESLSLILTGIMNWNFNQIFFGLVVVMPPLYLIIVSTIFVLFLSLFFNFWLSFMILLSGILFTITFIFALQLNRAPEEIWRGIRKIPSFMWAQTKGMININAANKDFMATSHQYFASFEEVWENRKKDFE